MVGDPGENTWCPSCKGLLIERLGFVLRANRIEARRCADCGTEIDGVEMSGAKPA